MTTLQRAEGLSERRRDILRLLKEWGKATATKLSKELGISRVAVHHHLSCLKEVGWVNVTVERQGRGRPAEFFSLTEQAQEILFPRRYEVLASTVLDEVTAQFGEEFLQKLLRRYREKLFERFEKRKVSLRERVKALANFLTEEGYFAKSEERKDGFVMTLHNCPIVQVAKRFRQACSSESEFLGEILNAPVTLQRHQSSGEHCCTYFISVSKRSSKKQGGR